MTAPPNDKLSPVAEEIVTAIRKKHRIERRRPVLNWTIGVAVVALAAAGLYGYASLTTADEITRTTTDQHTSEITDLQGQMKGVCRKVSNLNELTPEERDGCYRAENNIPPPNVTITEQPNVTVNGLNAGEVQGMINQAVSNLPKPLTVDQVTTAATAVYQANKPKEFTQADIIAAVTTFCGETQCQGKPGVQGEQGIQGNQGEPGTPAPPATPEQILEQVTQYCAQSGKCVGSQGVGIYSITGPSRRADDNVCVLHVEYDGKTAGGLTSQDLIVSDFVCPVI
jgi:hypothetical protein